MCGEAYHRQFKFSVTDCHPEERDAYADMKLRLAEQYRHDRHGYTGAKSPFIWSVMQKASEWSQLTGWSTGRGTEQGRS
ncbi:GrpB family protein [Paenibacillus sp. MER TA 81-3]|uniref:GrpB family protein n=1 Tax=Paenibacillus sp. MER TA 81-3 TaxID=2939573 RepID=UPI00203C6C22|nr:GrpB family protein [Paenibacillus sp. MER TA 81-3]